MRRDPHSAVISYAEGALGPTIVLDIPEATTLNRFQDLFHALAAGERALFELLHEPQVEVHGLTGLLARLVPDGKERARTVRRIAHAEGPRFEWSRDREGWLEVAELIDPLLESPGGHQYLADGMR